MIEKIYEALIGANIPSGIVVFMISLSPVSELRVAIPIGILKMHLPVCQTYLIAVLGNMAPVIPLLFLFEPLSNKLRKFKLWARFFDWFFLHTRRKAKIVERLETFGLMLFVAVPLPMTGAWSGCIAASLFKIPFRLAFPAIFVGVMIAGIIVTVLTKAVQSLV